MNSLWIILACGLAWAHAHPTCDETLIRKCDAIQPFKDGDDIFPSERLEETCRDVMSAFDCFEDLIDKCPGLLFKDTEDYFYKSKDLMLKICTPGSFQTKYLRHAKCMNDVLVTKRSVCEERVKDTVTLGSCPYFKAMENCMTTFIRNTCGREAFEIFTENFGTMYENDACH